MKQILIWITLPFLVWLRPDSLRGSVYGSGSSDQRAGDEMVWEGILAFYNYEFEKSVDLLSMARAKYPGHPAVHFTWAASRWLKAKEYEGVNESYEELWQSIDEVIPIYEDLVVQYPDDPHYRLFLAASKGLKARVHLGRKQWLSVVLEGMKGYWGVAKVHREYPQLWDAYFPVGMVNYYIGIVNSPVVRFVAGLLGIRGDTEQGFSQIQTAAEMGEFSWIEANLTLLFIYLWIDDDYESAVDLSDRMRGVSPGSIYNQHLYTESLIRVGRLQEAENNLSLTFKMAEGLPPVSRRGWVSTLMYQKALLEFYLGQYDRSLAFVTESIESFDTELDTPLGFGYLLRGNIYDLIGERKLAVSDYWNAVDLSNYSSAMKHAREYIRTPYRTTDFQLRKGEKGRDAPQEKD